MAKNGNSPSPAQQLTGKKLANGWTVVEEISRSKSATGGHFSTSYIVQSKTGTLAFLKAMDYEQALKAPDPARALQAMTAAFNFERDMHEKCRGKKLARVVTILDSGTVEPTNGEPGEVVQYLIFELADGDVRSFVDIGRAFETAWALRTIHQAAAALNQLHSINIAHQDIKPSNVLVFDKKRSKVADLGRASSRTDISPHDEIDIAGDQSYAPPEFLYGDIPTGWESRRLGCDMYLLGSLVVFFSTSGFSMTHLLLANLSTEHHHKNWRGTYREVLPYLVRGFFQVIRDIRNNVQQEHADKITECVKQLCHPDPGLRGHPRNMLSLVNQYSLERYVSIFGNLASRAEYSLKRSRPLSGTR